MNLISHLVQGTWPINCENHWKSRYPYINVKYSNIFVNVGVPSWVEVSQVFVAGSKVYLYVFLPLGRELFMVTHFLRTTFPLYAWHQEPMNSCVPMSRIMAYLSIGIVFRHIKRSNISQIIRLHRVNMLPCESGKCLGWGRLLYWRWAATTPSQPRPWLRPATWGVHRNHSGNHCPLQVLLLLSLLLLEPYNVLCRLWLYNIILMALQIL